MPRRETLNISYDSERAGDLKAGFDRLAQVRGSKWEGRSRADAAGMLLAEALEAELARHSIQESLTQDSQAPVNGESPVKIKGGAS